MFCNLNSSQIKEFLRRKQITHNPIPNVYEDISQTKTNQHITYFIIYSISFRDRTIYFMLYLIASNQVATENSWNMLMYCKTYFRIIFLFYFRKYKLYPLNLTMVKVQCSACDKEMRKNQWELERHGRGPTWTGSRLGRSQSGKFLLLEQAALLVYSRKLSRIFQILRLVMKTLELVR